MLRYAVAEVIEQEYIHDNGYRSMTIDYDPESQHHTLKAAWDRFKDRYSNNTGRLNHAVIKIIRDDSGKKIWHYDSYQGGDNLHKLTEDERITASIY